MTKPTKAATHAAEINPFITLRKILLDKEFDEITTTELDIAIEDHGIYAMGRNGRYEKHDYKSETGERALVLLDLFMKYKQNIENNIFDKELISPLEEYTEKSDPSEYELYGWMKSDLPATLSIALNQSEANTANQEQVKVSKPAIIDESTHEPANLSGIANIFTVNQVPDDNLEQWRKFAKDANRNGLYKARLKTGKGKAQSIYDPVAVGDWLISKGKWNMSRAKVDRILMKHLPTRSAHLKDLYKD